MPEAPSPSWSRETRRICATSAAESTVCSWAKLLRRLQRMLAPLVELILQSQALLISLDGAYRLHDAVDPCLRFELAKLARGRGAFARIVIGEARVPPDAGVQAFRQLQARLIGTGFLRRAIQVHEVGPRDHAHGCFALAGMHRSEERRVGKECRSRWSQY